MSVLGTSVAFYRDVLGFTVDSDSPTYAAVKLGGITLGLCPQDSLPASHYFDQDSLLRRKGSGVEIVIEVDDIEALYARVLASGYAIATGLAKRSWGFSDFRIVDPDGYYLRPTSRE